MREGEEREKKREREGEGERIIPLKLCRFILRYFFINNDGCLSSSKWHSFLQIRFCKFVFAN